MIDEEGVIEYLKSVKGRLEKGMPNDKYVDKEKLIYLFDILIEDIKKRGVVKYD